MSNESYEIIMNTLGFVKNEMKEPGVRPNLKDIVSEVEVYDEFAEGLLKIDEYSHAVILYHYHIDRHPDPKPMQQHAHANENFPVVGIFSLRGSDRPNRIGISMVKILEVGQNTLKVAGLDALDGSPVLDIKPYIPRADAIPEATVSEWQAEWQKQG